jgi:hypothetical protein
LKQALRLPVFADPDALMARLAMERDLAIQYKALLEKRGIRPAAGAAKQPEPAAVPAK